MLKAQIEGVSVVLGEDAQRELLHEQQRELRRQLHELNSKTVDFLTTDVILTPEWAEEVSSILDAASAAAEILWYLVAPDES